MNVYALIQGLNSVFALGTIFLVLFRKTETKPVHRAYVYWASVLFLWSVSYFMWGIQSEKTAALFWLRILMYAVSLIHACYFHFTLAFCESVSKYKKQLLFAYLSGVACIFINIFNGFMDVENVRAKGVFLFWPHAKPLLWLLIAFEAYFTTLAFYILNISIAKEPSPKKARLKIFFIANIIAWLGGMMNWFYWYDSIPIPPIGNLGVTFYMLVSTYLILKHDLLALNLAIKRTFLYMLLTLFIAVTYAIFIIVSEKLFQSLFGYSSLVPTLFTALTIAILFNPLRIFLTKLLDKTFFGKDIVTLSQENAQMKDELLKQDRMKAVATFAAGMAHEIKNPLTAIKTFTEHLRANAKSQEFIDKFEKVVGAEVGKIDSIVKQVLDFSKPSPLQLQNIHVEPILDETLELLNGELTKNQINVNKSYRNGSPIRGDKKQLKQAFLNLFLNGIEAMPNGGNFKVSTASTDSQVSIIICDSGNGISKEDLSHIFDPFFTTKTNGTGLGLSIVQGIIKEHGGKIEVKSEIKQGVEFKILFKLP